MCNVLMDDFRRDEAKFTDVIEHMDAIDAISQKWTCEHNGKLYKVKIAVHNVDDELPEND
jgi:hypothetical protein